MKVPIAVKLNPCGRLTASQGVERQELAAILSLGLGDGMVEVVALKLSTAC